MPSNLSWISHVFFFNHAFIPAKGHTHPRITGAASMAETDCTPCSRSPIVATTARIGGSWRGHWDLLGLRDPPRSNFRCGSPLHLVAGQYTGCGRDDDADEPLDIWFLALAGLPSWEYRYGHPRRCCNFVKHRMGKQSRKCRRSSAAGHGHICCGWGRPRLCVAETQLAFACGHPAASIQHRKMNSHQGQDLLAQKKPPAPQRGWRFSSGSFCDLYFLSLK
jgi:hypothetical protein